MELLLICYLFENVCWHLAGTFRNGTAVVFVNVMRKHIVKAWYFLIWLLWRTMRQQFFVRTVLLVLLREQSYQTFLIEPFSVILTQNPNRFFKSKHNSAPLGLWCVFFLPVVHFILPWMNLSIYRTVHRSWTNNLFHFLIRVLRLVLTFIHSFLVAICGLVTATVWQLVSVTSKFVLDYLDADGGLMQRATVAIKVTLWVAWSYWLADGLLIWCVMVCCLGSSFGWGLFAVLFDTLRLFEPLRCFWHDVCLWLK